MAGFYSHLYHDDEKKFTIAFMTNTTLPYSLRQPLAASLVEIMESGNYSKEHFDLPAQLLIKDTAGFLGLYKTGNGDSIHFFQGTHHLHVQRNNDLRYNAFIVDSVTAYAPGIDAWIWFSTQDNKHILHWNSVFQTEQASKSK